MFKKTNFLFFIFFTFFTFNLVSAQQSKVQEDHSYVNLFISANKTVYVETEKTKFENVEKKVSEIVRNMPFKPDQKIVYRIFADENLDLGYIMDVNQEMISGYAEDISTQRFLLNTMKLNIDGQNWFDAIDMKDLKKID